jgi:hypothetical protein
MGMGPGFQAPVPPVQQASHTPHLSEEEELAALKQQAEAIAQGLQSITERIEELERKKQGQ